MKTKRLSLIITLVCSVVAISGCVSQKESMIKQGYPLAYADGFDDGCHSGNKAGGSMFEEFKKDVKRFENDSQYAQGWSDGFRQCESEQEALQREIRMSIEHQRLIEEKKRNTWEEQRHLEREVMKGIDTDALKNLK